MLPREKYRLHFVTCFIWEEGYMNYASMIFLTILTLNLSCSQKPSFVGRVSSNGERAENARSSPYEKQYLEQSYKIEDKRTETINFELSDGRLSHEFVMQEGPLKSQLFLQKEFKGILDLVMVIDNSGSMKEEQQNLATKLLPLLSKIKDSDWTIAITTTDPGKNPAGNCSKTLRDLIKKSDDPSTIEQRFVNAINAGITGSGNERGFQQSINGLSCLLESGKSWIRQNSTVAAFVISDEDDCSGIKSGVNDCGTSGSTQSKLMLDYLSNAPNHPTFPGLGKKIGRDARFYALSRIPGDTTCTTASYPAVQYLEAVQATSGIMGSICSLDYSDTLATISGDIAKILKFQFELSDLPSSKSLQVIINGQPTKNFILTGQTLTFNEPPADSAEITVKYNLPVLQYPYKIGGTNPRDFRATIKSALSVDRAVDVEYKDGNFVVPYEVYEPDAIVSLSYMTNESIDQKLKIAYTPIENSLTINTNGLDCTPTQVASDIIDFTGCVLVTPSHSINITYQREQPRPKEFVFESYKETFEPPLGSWSVKINDKEVMHTRERNIFKLDEKLLSDGDVVVISYKQ